MIEIISCIAYHTLLFMKQNALLTRLAVMALLIGVFACSDSKKKPQTESKTALYTKYIGGFTAGVIKTNSTIKVRLAQDAKDAIPGLLIDQQLFDFTPSIDGTTSWEDQRTIVFKPESKLPSNTRYEVRFALDKVIEVTGDLKNFFFNFQTIQQAYEVKLFGLETESLENREKYKLIGVVQTADYADNDAIEKMIAAEQNGTGLSVYWTHEGDTKHSFEVRNIIRKEEAGKMEVRWAGEPIGVDMEGEESITVPSLGDYSIISASLVQNEEQYLSVMFSNPISTEQNFSGLLYIGSESKQDTAPRWVINKNELKIYPSQSILANLDEILIKVAKDVKSWDGKKLLSSFEKKIPLPKREPEVELDAHKGIIMVGEDQMILPFRAVGLKAVDVSIVQIFEDNVLQYLQVNPLGGTSQLKRVGRLVKRKKIDLETAGVMDLNTWNRFTLDLSTLVDIQQGAVYQVGINFRKEYSLYFCPGLAGPGLASADDLQSTEEDWTQEEESSYWDDYSSGYEYDWSQRNNPCHPSYYGKRREVSKLVFASELGLIAKRGEQGDLVVFVTNIKSTKPMEGVSVTAYDFQQQPIGSAKSGGNGMVSISLSAKPFAIVAKSGKEFGYLKLDDGSALSLSNFDVSGEKIQKGIKGYIYSERGVWRPGDSLYLDFMLEDKQKALPAEHPVVMELYNPQGQLHSRNVGGNPLSQQSASGIYSFLLSTPQDAPTGNWSAKVKVGSASFSKQIKIEAVKPNRLKVKLDFGKEYLSVANTHVSAKLSSRWLHGATAGNLKATIDMSAIPATTQFKGFPNFSFDDPSKEFYAATEEIFSGRLDSEGNAEISMKTDVGKNAPGVLKALFRTKVFEEGGDFSINTMAIPYYPYESFVGVQVPEGDKRNMLLTDKDHTIQIAAVDADGNPVNRDKVKVELFKLNWKWWWDNSHESLSNYIGRSHKTPLQHETINVSNGRADWKLRVNHPEWGRYYIRVTDPVSGHSAGKIIYMDWPGWAGKGRGDLGGATMLSFTTDKETYQVGEQASLFIPSSAGSRALVSIESGSKILNAFWVETAEEKTNVTFEVTEDMTPNVYVHVSLLQPHAQTKNDLPIRMYGVNPIQVEDPQTQLHPIIAMPETLSPERPFTIKVKEENGKPMAYTIAVVDEGLLDLTNFETPSPWKKFYAREALGVKTWDLYDQVIGAYGARLERLLAIGGDGEIKSVEEKQESRFKPVVKHIGPFFLEAGDEASHSITLPPYIGSVRTMLVAAHEGAYGSAEKATPVKQSLMVLPTLPRVVGPGEKIALPVTVFASEDVMGQIKVSVKTSGLLKIKGSSEQNITFSKAGEKMIFFDLEADQAIGYAKVSVEVASDNANSSYEVPLEVRAANPKMNRTLSKVLKAGENLDFNYEPLGIAGTNEAVLEVSALPPLNLEQRLQYLIQYPHGCVEQTTSSVFAQLYLDKLIKLDDGRKLRIQKNIEAAIDRLKSFQVSSGGFAYWPGQSEASTWGTNYAGHFLVEARKQGYFVPANMLDEWADFQTTRARQWNPEAQSQEDDALIQAYRLYTLALMDKPAVDAMNRMRESGQISASAKWRLAIAYAKIGQLEPAKQLVAGLSKEVTTSSSQRHTYGSKERDQAMILETLASLNRQEEAFSLVKLLSNSMSDNDHWMSTQTTAYCLIAISAYAKGFTVDGNLDVNVAVGGLNNHYASDKFVTQVFVAEADKKQPVKVTNNGQQAVYVQLITRGTPLAGNEVAVAKKINLNVVYKSKDGSPVSVEQMSQGKDFMVEVTVHNPGTQGDYTELALTQIFPSGWEIINTRLDGSTQFQAQDVPEYQDIRDDRVYTYFDLKANEKKVFRILLNASYQGQFYLSAASVEAMYDHSIHANTEGQWVAVQK